MKESRGGGGGVHVLISEPPSSSKALVQGCIFKKSVKAEELLHYFCASFPLRINCRTVNVIYLGEEQENPALWHWCAHTIWPPKATTPCAFHLGPLASSVPFCPTAVQDSTQSGFPDQLRAGADVPPVWQLCAVTTNLTLPPSSPARGLWPSFPPPAS